MASWAVTIRSIVVVSTFFIIYQSAKLLGIYHLFETPPERHTTMTRDFNGVVAGISLSTNYGTIALREDDGSYTAVAKVDGDRNYIEMMQRLSRESSKHATPPYGQIGDGIMDAPRQFWRNVRKRFGWPASADVGTLCSVLEPLKAHLIARLQETDSSIAQVAVSCPPILALYEEDIRDALEYLKIPSWTGNEVAYNTPNEMLVAFTGHGMKNMNGPDGTAKNVLLIEYTKEALSLECDHVNSGGSRIPGKQNANFGTGSRQSNTPAHWTLVQTDVERAVKMLIPTWKPTVDLVLLVGESSDDQELRKRIGQMVAPFGNPEIISSDGLYVAAKGTAELAWSYVKAEVQREALDEKTALDW